MTQKKELATRPLITLVIVAYEQEAFIADAVNAAFAQTYSPLEIIISDDGSNDRTMEIIDRLAKKYTGVAEVTTRQSTENIGLIGHLNDVMAIARGEWIVMAAGDDLSDPNRVLSIYNDVYSHPHTTGHFSGFTLFDSQNSNLGSRAPTCIDRCVGDLYVAAHGGYVCPGATYAFDRSIIDFFGAIPNEAVGEDAILPLRSALRGSIYLSSTSLVRKRITTESLGTLVSGDRSHHKTNLAVNLESVETALQRKALSPLRAAWLCFALKISHRSLDLHVRRRSLSVLKLIELSVLYLLVARFRNSVGVWKRIVNTISPIKVRFEKQGLPENDER